ncbi:MAG: sigma 54-interacting transcriptional regulator [Candidatus Competibacteraceae bacterium]
MQYVFEQIRQVSKWNTTVLIRGESGTGKSWWRAPFLQFAARQPV